MTLSPESTLIVIDIQNDYFDGGHYPQWQAEQTRQTIESLIDHVQKKNIPVILVQHQADNSKQPAPFFNPDTEGVEIHPSITASAPKAPVVIKQHADSFLNTSLEEHLSRLGSKELLICGMMTQNCVTHTAISESAAKYRIKVVSDACTSIEPMVHGIALKALSDRVELIESTQLIASATATTV